MARSSCHPISLCHVLLSNSIIHSHVRVTRVLVLLQIGITLVPKQSQSDSFMIAGGRWRLLAFPNGTNYEFFYQYLGVAGFQSLTSTWRRHVKLRLTIVNGLSDKRSIVTDSDLVFDEMSPTCRYPTVPPPSRILERNGGFLLHGALTIVVEVVALEVISTSGGSDNGGVKYLLNKTQKLKESVDVNGFQVLPSQVGAVKRIFERYPDIASGVRSKKRSIRTTYMNVLLGLIEMLCQLPVELSDDDLDEASIAVSYVAKAGFKVDWLEKKLEEVKEKKEKVDTGKARLQQMKEDLQKFNQKCLDLKALMEKDNADLLAANLPLSFDDVV